ncbi:MAG: fluoride efflux transporter CrcB [Halanaerobium sp.]|nr:fluoride efflux transporter CrcB [Halanaerobium sp.]
MLKVIAVGLGGFFGAISRYLISGWVERYFQGTFPFGTLTVNLVGCFLLGFLYALTLEKEALGPIVRIGITTGFLGALTTFSTFSLETLTLLEGRNYYLGLGNVFISLLLGLMLAWFGMVTARIL